MDDRWIGSLTTPTQSAVMEAGRYLRNAVVERAAGRNAGFSLLCRYHNCYALYTAFLLAFACGARACASYGWNANLERRDWFCYFKDKAPRPWKQPRPMLLPETVVEHMVFYKVHCAALLGRIERRSLGTPALRRRLSAIARAQAVPLLFLISHRGGVAKLGSSELCASYPAHVRLVADAGRHYFATWLFLERVEDALIDFFLRHAESGTEPQSSTSVIPLRSARDQVCSHIDAHLSELGLGAVPGLAGD